MFNKKLKITQNVPAGGIAMSNVSFVVSKVDSPQMINRNVRIINNGQLDSVGRVEVKLDGKWNTVKAVEDDLNNMNNIAKASCR
mmetsp:Transcript_43363/g.36327  ORF Transcript_43363/g.36327 Transcript_43363/m.36327 type:complete len:84 (+) Transcript_43363:1263-1514(+)